MSTSDGETAPASVRRRMLAGRYAVAGVLGRGGMGVVWGAEDTVIGRKVAIKELTLPDGIPDGERQVYEERVLREARTTGRLNDPGVVTVYDVLTEGGSTYIVMELIEAPTLAEKIREQGALPQEQVLAVAETILSALDTAHAAGVVHRDVKPSNIMVLGNGRVKLTDFGIAQALDDPRLTTSGTLIGSPAFMAPERIAHAAATPSSDLWSFGATLFNAVEGYPAFERQNTAATMHAIMNNETPRLQRANGVLASIIAGLLVAAPEARLNAPGVRALLTAARGAGSPPGGTAPMQGMPGGTMAYGGPPPTMVAHQPDRQARKPGRARWAVVLVAVALLAAAAGFGGGFLAATQSADSEYQALSYGQRGQVPTFDLADATYDCLTALPADGVRITANETVTCEEDHAAEVYYQFEVFNTGSEFAYPGEEQVRGLGDSLCEVLFNTDQVDLPGKDVTLTHTTVYPTGEQWNSSSANGDYPDIFCVAASADGKPLTRSVVSGN